MYQRYESFKEYNQKTVLYKNTKKENIKYFDIIIAINQNDAKSFKECYKQNNYYSTAYSRG